MEAWLWRVWQHGGIGLYIDEMVMMPPRSTATRTILATGRSLKLPMIMLSQRPKMVPLHVFSEANYHAIFHLNFEEDIDRVREFFHSDIDLYQRLPPFHSYWYDVKRDVAHGLKPVPDDAVILERLNSRLSPRRRFL